jgi:hypothetical protein
MPFWRFMDYITEGPVRTNPVSDWYGSLEPPVQAEFDVLVRTLAETDDWDRPKLSKRKYKVLIHRHAGLCELKFKVGDRKFRPIGILHSGIREFIFLGGCEKTGFFGTTDPPEAFDRALLLKEAYDKNRGTTREHI